MNTSEKLREAFGRKVFYIEHPILNALMDEVIALRKQLAEAPEWRGNPYQNPLFSKEVALEFLEKAMRDLHQELVDEQARFDRHEAPGSID